MFSNIIHNVKSAVGQAHDHLTQQSENTPGGIMGALQELTLGEYHLKPLDAVLFSGNDPVANMIKRIELHEVVPRINRPFHVNKEVLPLDCLEEGKMYIFESVFSGQVAGYVYSKILPVDHVVAAHGNHLGPQIRDFEAVVNEGDSNVGICPLTPEQRKFMESRFAENPNLLLDLYNKYHDYGYPMTNILSVVASASQSLYNDLQLLHKETTEFFPHHKEQKKDTVFCSELVSIIYKEIGHPSFVNAAPDTFTPLAVEIVPEFGSVVFYAKENKVSLLKHGNKVSTGSMATKAQKMIKNLAISDRWIKMPPSGGIPPGAEPAGKDLDGTNLYIARAEIGGAFYLGKIGENWEFPCITYFGREVRINFGHEVLASLDGLYWEDANDGHVPLLAVKAGMEEDGRYLYVARGLVGASHGVMGVGKREGAYAPGVVATHLKGAKFPFDGKEVSLPHYQVLCQKAV
ncbi:hypothetical protein HDU98_000575 [Podochytrium sp. JEL0797]|nr:hypothetical protein HDU98_000575 [Podochytrium sp. JEL0797]